MLDMPSARASRREKKEERLHRALVAFPSIPDDALIDINVLCVIRCRSRASTWRDVANGHLAHPVKVGSSTRWRVGDVRASLTHAGAVA